MNLKDQLEKLRRINDAGLASFASVKTTDELEQARVKYLGRKSELASISSSLKNLTAEERKALGAELNSTRGSLESALNSKAAEIFEGEQADRLRSDRVDVSLPGRQRLRGRRNPLTLVIDDITDAFLGLGFSVARGPEVETDHYNFQALNIPPDHPARSMWDTIYLESDSDEPPLFRTHTSPVQARVMESQPPPVYVIVPGRCARRETVSASSLAGFIQIEGLAADEGITMGDLKGTLEAFAKAMFGDEQRVRLIPDYFPFTEPSASVEVVCFVCGGGGCPTCKKEGWIELMGAGMVHPNVFKEVGYPEAITGFAFGVGVERVAMARYGVSDIRWFYENDLDFLGGF